MTEGEQEQYLARFRERCREELLGGVLPFWMEHGLDWAWAHLKDPEYPEWFGYLHRDGTVAQPAKGNLFKGPFHIPRMLVKCQTL